MSTLKKIAFGLIAAAAILSGCGPSDPVEVGSIPPSFNVVYLNDRAQTQNLAALRGKVVLVDFWATWCGPCNIELPKLQAIYEKYKDKGVEMLAISTEDRSTLFEFQKRKNLTIPIFVDEGLVANKALKIAALPTTFVVGKDGKVVYSDAGYGDGIEKEIQDAIDKALSG